MWMPGYLLCYTMRSSVGHLNPICNAIAYGIVLQTSMAKLLFIFIS